MKNKLNTSLSLRKLVLSAMVAAPMATLPAPLWALPVSDATNLTSSAGAATVVTPAGASLTITTPDRSVLRWGNFNVGTGETVSYVLPAATSAVLNTVSTGATTIDGTISSNGSVFILNPNGIAVTSNGSFSAAGVGLSTLPESEFAFLANGTLSLTGTPSAAGDITITHALAAPANPNTTPATPAIPAVFSVGKTGTVLLAGNDVSVTGSIDAGTLNVTSKAADAANLGSVKLGNGGALDLGMAATTDAFGVVTPGYGTLNVNSNGGSIIFGSSNVTVRSGNATLNTTQASGAAAGSISQTGGTLVISDGTTSNSNLTINTGTSDVTLSKVQNGVQDGALRVTLTSGETSLTSTAGSRGGTLQLMNSTVSGNLTVSAGNGNITSGGVVDIAAGKTISLTATGTDKAGSITFKGRGDLNFTTLSPGNVTGTSVTVQSTEGSIVLPSISRAGSITVTAAKDITQAAGTTISTNFSNSFSIDYNTSTNVVNGVKNVGNQTFINLPTVTFSAPTTPGGITAAGHFVANSDGTVKFVLDTAGSGYTAAPTLTFTNTGAANITGNAGTSTFDAGGTTTITNAGNKLGKVQIKNSPNGATVVNSTNLILGTSSATGAVDLTAPSIVLGGASGDKVNVDSTLKLTTTGGNVTDGTDNARILGSVTINATGAVILDGSTSSGVGLNSTYGQVNVSATAVTVYESTTLNLGAITTTGKLRAVSTNGDIVNTGQLKVQGATEVGAGTAAAPGNISLNYTTGTAGQGNQLMGVISVLDDVALLTNANANQGDAVGNYLAKNVTIVNEPTTVIGNIVSATNGGIAGDLSVTSTRTSADTLLSVPVTSAASYSFVPTVTVSAPQTAGGVQATAVATRDTTTGALTVTVTNPGSGYTSAPTFTFSGGATTNGVGTVTVAGGAVTAIPVTSTVYTSAPTIQISAPQVAGGVQATATATLNTTTGAITVAIAPGSSGYTSAPTVTLVGGTMAAGGLLGTPVLGGANVVLGGTDGSGQVNVAGKVILSAPEALLANNSSNAISNYTATAGGNVLLRSAGPVTINATLTQNAAGKTATYTSGDALSIGSYTSNYTGLTTFQSGNKKAINDTVAGILIYGDVAFKSADAINITKSGHNFGGLTITPGNDKSATVVESGTMRLVDVSVGKGSLTVTSTNGSIIQDQSANNKGIRFSDTGSNKGTFNASNGNVTLDDTNMVNNFPNASINVTSAGDALVRVGLSNLTLGNITTGGNFTADVSSSIGVSGTISITSGGTYGSMPTIVASAPNVAGGVAPTFTVTADTTTPNTVGAVVVKSAGRGYTSAPTLSIVSNGQGYTSAPTVTISAPTGGVTAAVTATAAGAGGSVDTLVATNPGLNYAAAPTVTLSAPPAGGTQATATATIDATGKINGFTITNPGAGYTAAPTVTVSPANVTATATATINPATGLVTGYTILPANAGSGYTVAPTVTLTNTGTGATINAAAPVVTLNGTALNTTVALPGGLVLNSSALAAGSSGKQITQATGTKINAYGTTSFLGANNTVNVSNTGNRFGGLVINSGTGDATITEATTMNLKSVTAANLTALSENGSIIDSVDANIANNRIAVSGTASSTASFSAPKGNIALSLAGSDYNTVALTTGGNASIIDAAGSITLAASTVTGTLDVTELGAGTIGQSGTLIVGGNTTFLNGTGSILLTNSANQFGPVRFTVGVGGAQISEGTTFNLRAGSVATGPVIISTGGDFITSGTGGSSFTDALTIQANGNITPGAGSLLVVKTFTVFSNNTKDLSKLSKSGNLTNQDPVNFGTGTYIPPSP